MGEFARAMKQAIEDLATAQLAGSTSDEILSGTWTALKLIRAMRKNDPAAASHAGWGSAEPDPQQQMVPMHKDIRTLQLQTRHRALVKEIRDMVDAGKLQISSTSATYWGAVATAPGHVAMTYVSQGDIISAVSVAASLRSGKLSVTM